MKLYHGTALPYAKNILNHGFNPSNTNLTWRQSLNNTTYFYQFDPNNSDNEEDEQQRRIEDACWNAIIGTAVRNINTNDMGIIELTVSDELFSEWFDVDSSSEYMVDAVEILTEKLNDLIKSQQIEIKLLTISNIYRMDCRFLYLLGLGPNVKNLDLPESDQQLLNIFINNDDHILSILNEHIYEQLSEQSIWDEL